MKKLESSLRNMTLSLGSVTLIAALLLSWVNGITKEPIKQAELATQSKALAAVLPEHDNQPLEEKFCVTINEGTADSVLVTIYPAKMNGKLVGAAVESTADGYADKVTVIYGFEQDGTVRNYAVMKQMETPGLGAKMQDWFRNPTGKRSVIGRNPGSEDLTVTKDGGTVDAITAATISSRTFLKTLNDAFTAYQNIQAEEKGGQQ
jgi:electron transport complex protein RnfG